MIRNGLLPKMLEVKKVNRGREERYLTFSLAGKEFGIEILKVHGVIPVRSNRHSEDALFLYAKRQ